MERSQHDFALNTGRKRAWPTGAIALFLTTGTVLFSGSALPQTLVPPMTLVDSSPSPETEGGEVAENLVQNVVRIEAKMNDHAQNGFGFIVGERAGTLYVVTANHVVSDPQAVGEENQVEVKIEFYERRGETYTAKLLGTHDVAHDLAVLTVPAPPRFRWNRLCLGKVQDQRRPTPVWFIGKDQSWRVSVTPGHVTSEVLDDSRIDVDGLTVRRGSSGGPLIAATGIVGMIQSDSADDTKALSIFFIRDEFLKWRHPWGLEHDHWDEFLHSRP